MNSSLLELLVCPRCDAPSLVCEGGETAGEAVRCEACRETYPIEEGILNLLYDPPESVLKEIEGMSRISETWFDGVPADLRPLVEGDAGREVLLGLPRIPRPELVEGIKFHARLAGIADDYFELLDWLDFQGTETVAEVGADSCWSARRLSERAGLVVATDVNRHLAMGGVYLEKGARFERVRCCMATFPFRPGCLDIVFSVASIHHAGDLEAVFTRFERTLKPGGRAVLFDEPVCGLGDQHARQTFGLEERALGVQEHVYTIDEYFDAARCARLRPHVIPLTGLLRDNKRRWALARRAGLALIRLGIGRTAPFTRSLYPWMLRRYPRIPFPHFALVLQRP